MELINFVPMREHASIIGTATYRIPSENFTFDVNIIKSKNGGSFPAMPQKSFKDEQGNIKYFPVARFDKECQAQKNKELMDLYNNFVSKKTVADTVKPIQNNIERFQESQQELPF